MSDSKRSSRPPTTKLDDPLPPPKMRREVPSEFFKDFWESGESWRLEMALDSITITDEFSIMRKIALSFIPLPTSILYSVHASLVETKINFMRRKEGYPPIERQYVGDATALRGLRVVSYLLSAVKSSLPYMSADTVQRELQIDRRVWNETLHWLEGLGIKQIEGMIKGRERLVWDVPFPTTPSDFSNRFLLCPTAAVFCHHIDDFDRFLLFVLYEIAEGHLTSRLTRLIEADVAVLRDASPVPPKWVPKILRYGDKRETLIARVFLFRDKHGLIPALVPAGKHRIGKSLERLGMAGFVERNAQSSSTRFIRARKLASRDGSKPTVCERCYHWEE